MKTTLSLMLITALAVSCGKEGPEGPQGIPGPTGAEGKQGEAGAGATPSIASITPVKVAKGLSQQVVIQGSGTNWTESTLVSFGEGVSVGSIRAPSPTSLYVEVTVAADAPEGARDVVVTTGGKDVTFANLFKVVPEMEVVVMGAPKKGGLAMVRILNNGRDPFDTSFSGSVFPGVAVSFSPAMSAIVRDVLPYEMVVLAGAAVDAVKGARQMTLVNRKGRATEKRFDFPAVFTVEDAIPTNLVLATPVTGNMDTAFGSSAFKFSGALSSDAVVIVSPATAGTGTPKVIPMTTAGAYSAASTPTNSFIVAKGTAVTSHVALFDPSGASGYGYTLKMSLLTTSGESEPNENAGVANALVPPAQVEAATYSSATDVDYYKVTLTSADVGRTLRVRTRAYSYYNYNDTKLEVVNPSGTLVGSADVDRYEDLSIPVTAEGVWLIKTMQGNNGLTLYDQEYNLAVTLE